MCNAESEFMGISSALLAFMLQFFFLPSECCL
uniref:Uncharacterized protein n=1 Tax=Rhizophora mucronata TaxID=61149 RepID=A0A2P2L4M0_RHIMU